MPLLFAINFYYPAKNVLGIYIETALSMSCKHHSSFTEEPILMKLYIPVVAIYNLRIYMKEDNPGPLQGR